MTQMTATSNGVAGPPLAVLVIITAVGPLAINLFVPSMPRIAADLDASYATIQLGLSLFLFFMAIVQLITGPISDRVGRRPVLIGGLTVFVAGSAMCALAPNTEMFLLGRVVQTTSAVGIMLSRTIVRDVYPREKSASIIGYVVMAMTVAPMIAPALGGLVDELAGWRMVFVMMGGFGAIALAAVWVLLPETNANRGQRAADQVRAWGELVAMPTFWLYAMSTSLVTMVFFAFLGGGPAVSSIALGMSPFDYGLWFALCAMGYGAGNFITGRYAQRFGIEAMMRTGAFLTCSCPLVILALFLAGANHPAALFVPMMLVGIGNGIALPNAIVGVISLKPDAAGAASGLVGALQIGFGGFGAAAAGIVIERQPTAVALATLMLMFGLAAVIATLFAIRAPRPAES